MAIEFARLGAKLSISDIDLESVTKTKEMIDKLSKKKKFQVLVLKLDVSNRQEIRLAALESRAKLGDVEILVNNAGIVQGKLLKDMDEFMLRKTLVVNLECHFWLIKEFLGPMMDKNEGHIVSISSVAGMLGIPYMTDYCASKYGALGLMEALRTEFKTDHINIKTTTVCPTFINTGMFEGVKTHPFYPLLDQDRVVRRIVDAIRQEEELVVLYYHILHTISITNMLPIYVKDTVNWMVGGFQAMVDVKTREQQMEEKKKSTS